MLTELTTKKQAWQTAHHGANYCADEVVCPLGVSTPPLPENTCPALRGAHGSVEAGVQGGSGEPSPPLCAWCMSGTVRPREPGMGCSWHHPKTELGGWGW